MACGEAGKVPKGVFPKEKMRDVLLDMVMADAYSYENPDPRMPLADSVRRNREKVFYKQILDIHHITQAEFKKSYDWYESRPDRMKEVYDLMMEVATAKREGLEKESRIKDYMDEPFAALPFGNNILSSKRHMLPTPFLKQLTIPVMHKPEPPKPAGPQPNVNKPKLPIGNSHPLLDKEHQLRPVKKEDPMGQPKSLFKPKQ
jgi:hypothetical protein